MRTTGWLRWLVGNQRGANIVEYIGVTGLALLLAGTLIVGVMHGRYTIGRVMAAHLAGIVASFEVGHGGTANTPTRLYPHVDLAEREFLLPQVTIAGTISDVVVALPRLVGTVGRPALGGTSVGTPSLHNGVTAVAPGVPRILLPVVGIPAIVD